MLIQDMPHERIVTLLKTTRTGHLACSQGLQPYLTPFSFAYDGDHIYSFGTVGQKIRWMRANPLVCVQVEQISSWQEWKSVIIFGRYEELPNTPEFHEWTTFAHDLLEAANPVWWEPGYVKSVHHSVERALETIWFRISIHEMTGHQGVPDNSPVQNYSPKVTVRRRCGQYLRTLADVLEQKR